MGVRLSHIIEHRHDLASTVGHGDKFSRERISWRARRWTEDRPLSKGGGFEWRSEEHESVRALLNPHYWANPEISPMMKVGE